MKHWILSGALALASFAAAAQPAPVTVSGAWARASVQGQRGTGAFMSLTASEPLSLVGASSPAAGVAEVHEMKMDGDVMRMRPITALELPAGKPVELKPGGYHLMLMELKAPLAPRTAVPVTLTFRNARGQTSQLQVQVPVGTQPPPGGHGAQPAPAHGHKH